jgi:hypothetical protein
VPVPPVISWERIDAPGAFDLNEGIWEPFSPGQSIEAILAVEACPLDPHCDEVSMYVAGGHTGIQESASDAAVWISENGREWTAVDGPGFSHSDAGGRKILALATDGRRIVAAGTESRGSSYAPESALVWYSDDLGRTWIPVDEASLPAGCRGMMDVAWSGDGFIGVGYGFWHSPDGVAWTQAASASASGGGVEVHSLTRWQSTWIAVGRVGTFDAAIWTSGDGRSWDLVFEDAGDALSVARDVTPGPSGPVVVGWTESSTRLQEIPAVWRSADGSSWLAVPPNPEWGIATMWDEPMDHVVAFGDWLIAAGNFWERWGSSRVSLRASPDGGTTWIDVPLDDAAFSFRDDGFGAFEVMRFPPGGEPRLVLAGAHSTDAAIWVGTLEE